MKSFVLLALAACSGLSSPPEPRVSVLVRSQGGCFASITPDEPIAPELGVVGTCADDAPPIWLAGIDQLEVVVDYGPDVDFAANTHAPPPTIVVTVDNAPSATPVSVGAEQRDGSRAYFIATFRAPATPSPDARVSAEVVPGFSAIVPDVFTIELPEVAVFLDECTLGMPCNLAGGVGDVHATLSVPGDQPETIAVSTFVDGVAQGATIPDVITQPAASYLSTGSAAIPVPIAPAGSTFTIAAQLGAAPPTTYSTTLVAPQISAVLSCGDSCALAPGDPVGLSIIAPAGIAATQAIVDTSLDGVPQLVAAPVALVPGVENAIGSLALTTPAKGSWQITATVAGYPSNAIVTSVP
ncbi:MAG TPA: hypothetical protein VMJ10_35285 [Kofleriaceae bacterium]|nr:hypothetical protein [Kofleriaceae bacterium]